MLQTPQLSGELRFRSCTQGRVHIEQWSSESSSGVALLMIILIADRAFCAFGWAFYTVSLFDFEVAVVDSIDEWLGCMDRPR